MANKKTFNYRIATLNYARYPAARLCNGPGSNRFRKLGPSEVKSIEEAVGRNSVPETPPGLLGRRRRGDCRRRSGSRGGEMERPR